MHEGRNIDLFLFNFYPHCAEPYICKLKVQLKYGLSETRGVVLFKEKLANLQRAQLDLQERFRPVISGMPAIIDTARRMIRGASALELPVIVTEQYPKALGSTVKELSEVLPSNALVQDKLHFSMIGKPLGFHPSCTAILL